MTDFNQEPEPQPEEPIAKPKRSPLWLLFGGGIGVALIIGLAVALTGGNGGGDQTIHVSMILTDLEGEINGTNGNCSGTGGYDDFGAGMNVVVKDDSGETIGTGDTVSLDDAPEYFKQELGDTIDYDEEASALCMVVADVKVETSDFYAVEVGNRGSITFDHDELEERNFEASLSLG